MKMMLLQRQKFGNKPITTSILITQEKVSNLISDVAYLEHEAEALKYVIDSVPLTDEPLDGMSIIETLLFLDHSQQQYYRKVVDDCINSHRPINSRSYIAPNDSFEYSKSDEHDVQNVLHKIAKHRAAFITTIEDKPIVVWEKEVISNEGKITLFEFIQSMVKQERALLKKIADLILTFQNEKQFQREVAQRKGN